MLTYPELFHEAKEALKSVVREYTEINSLTVGTAYNGQHACELAVRGLWHTAVGTPFPYAEASAHSPNRWVTELGIGGYYSPETQTFLDTLTGYGLHEARYAQGQAYIDHVKPTARGRAKHIVQGVRRMLEETEALAQRPGILEVVRRHQDELR
jgi:hypothetical protein